MMHVHYTTSTTTRQSTKTRGSDHTLIFFVVAAPVFTNVDDVWLTLPDEDGHHKCKR